DVYKRQLQERQGLNKTNKLYLVKPEVTEDDIYKIQKQENTVESSNGKEVGKTDFKKSIKQNLMILNLAILNLTILK
ncbi:replication protein A, partial [Staphylococcus aureus]|nr:replication protein A [Staphylococcus aureus]